MAVLILSLVSCTDKKDEKLTVKDIEIFKDTPAWDFAKALEKSNLKKAKEILSDNGDLVNYQDPEFGTTLLMRAISTENYQTVEFLLQNGANPNIVAEIGTTALFRSVSHSWKDVTANTDPRFVKIMLEYGADPNINYCSPKIEGQADPIECGTSPLMHATQRGFEKVKLLVEAGAEINYKTELGKTAAIKALLNEKVDVAHYLIVEKKAKVSEPYFSYNLFDESKIDYEKPHYPIDLLENWLFELGSEKHKLKMEIVEEFKRQGQDYWSMEKHPKTVERIKKTRPENWEEYLQKY
ncbi:Ankyrin repeat-containing protein [Belliella pelovolcani]|uniref:Ankyrin repeat-containing protein n=2 Tax=Belliella pelovolcani TaxID=529505 RepID=A0A1N7MK07_9BACT|nr:Ankyrin repeat-containing protein [Belliella pelovolcani]